MPGPISKDLRERVVGTVIEDGLSCREAARRFKVSASSAVKWVQRARRTGQRQARTMGGDRRSVLPAHRGFILHIVEAEAETTLWGLSARLETETGVKADASMLHRFMKAERISFKKKPVRSRAGAA
jgi:transposase